MKVKECAKCHKSGNIMYRVKIDASKNWFFLCKDCTKIEKDNNKFYIYGGTWKGYQ